MAVCGVCGSDGSTCRLVAELNDPGRRLTDCVAVRQEDAARAAAKAERLAAAELEAEARWRREHPRSRQPWPRLESVANGNGGLPPLSELRLIVHPDDPTCPRCGHIYDGPRFRIGQLIECGQCNNPTRVRLVPHHLVNPALFVA
ncbi:MAG: hypothetical protein Q7S64_01410 [bacterium]|nr:hypothetical protein [bacterium]